MEDGGGWVDDRELTWACWELRGTIENEELPLAERDAAAAKMQNPGAQYLLGKLYLMGEGVEQNEDTAYEWFQAAAEQDHTYAQFFVDQTEQQGQYVSPSLLLSATQLLHHMGNSFRDNAPTVLTSGSMHIDSKRLQKFRAKKITLGTSQMTMRRSRTWAA